jgi:PAS domain-containing protein
MVAAHMSLPLILAHDLAQNLATPVFLVDPEGTLLFYNEPAEAILGRRYAEVGTLKASEWAGDMWNPRRIDDKPLPFDENPLAIALTKHKPAHTIFRLTGLDGIDRVIAATAFPLFAKTDEFVGAVAIFWEHS